VKVSSSLDDGTVSVVDIYTTDEYFGEGGLLGKFQREESAVALESVSLMSWTAGEIEEQVERIPKLGMALLRMMVQRCVEFEERVQSLALEKTTERVARSLLRFAERWGEPQADGSVRIPPLTHQLLSEYVGTSREIVTFQMNHLRSRGYMSYSRKGINVQSESLREYVDRAQRAI
jgi:CRP/FNR family transcriptional regulator